MKMSMPQKVLIRDWNLSCRIGAYDSERDAAQNVRVDMDVTLAEGQDALDLQDTFDPDRMFCYATYIQNVQDILNRSGHIDLLETLVPLLAEIAFQHKLVDEVRVQAIKTDAFDDADVGIEMEFQR